MTVLECRMQASLKAEQKLLSPSGSLQCLMPTPLKDLELELRCDVESLRCLCKDIILAWTAITEYHPLVLSSSPFLTVLDAGNLSSGYQCGQVLVSLLPGLQLAAFLQREEALFSLPLPLRALIPSWGLHLHDLIYLITPSKVHSLISSYWGLGFNVQILEVHEHSVHNRDYPEGISLSQVTVWEWSAGMGGTTCKRNSQHMDTVRPGEKAVLNFSRKDARRLLQLHGSVQVT